MEEQSAVFQESRTFKVTPEAYPDFYQLFQRSVFLALQEDGILDAFQVQHCLEQLQKPG
ncbi:MAG: hypothetical protein ACOYJZ_03820 [Acutalibacter sp.]